MKKMTKTILCFLVIASLVMTVNAAGSVPEKVIKATDSVVRILAKYSDGYGTGTGFVIKSDREGTLILTNYHVVEDNPYSISVWGADEELINAEILSASSQKDLCVLRLTQPVSMDPVLLSKESAKKGDAVYAVGFPAAADVLSDTDAHTSQEATITNGIVSALREATTVQFGSAVKILQISAAINSGNSGGPLFDSNGRVVGINTYGIADAQGIFGAIDILEIHDFLRENGITMESKTQLPLIFIAIGLVAVAALVFLILRKKGRHNLKRKKQSVTLRQFMTGYPAGLGVQDAVALLLPVALQLRDMHNNGRPHLQVSPDSIIIDDTSILMAPSESESNRYSSGFAAKEVYNGIGRGILSDIYSFCAVLQFASSGVIPQNSLQRNGEDICTNQDAAFAQIINQGMQMEPEARFDSMQSLILKLSAYNVKPFAPEIVAVQNTHSQKKKKSREKLPVAAAVLIVVLTILVAAVSAYFVGYKRAYQFSQSGDYAAARQCLFVPQITQMHDQQIGIYIEAGSLMDSRQYAEAKKLFQSLPGFLDSDNMVLETDYRYAAQLADANEFDTAILQYNLLAKSGYKDAEEKSVETRYRKTLYFIYEKQNYLVARSLLRSPDFDQMENISAVRSELNELLYHEAIDFYRRGKYLDAELRLTSGYKDSDKYLLLIRAHNNQNGYIMGDFYDETVKNLKEIFYFEDASELLISSTDIACTYLLGTWKTSNGGYYFKMERKNDWLYEYYSSYNIPWFGGSFEINNGIYSVTKGSYEDKPQYKFDLLTPDSMNLYCYKDGKTYTLYRQ